ncbi:7110_t:CDS:2 [Cetraspora pellucida]|uniref:7110_t:CDS:1 n=1 Tax=Cetraspora pellucida TaxID=1433469 RepID=A0A9N9I472_9GLOM|nr:7110_t:CDS:2 [Cetraspora pellucida]
MAFLEEDTSKVYSIVKKVSVQHYVSTYNIYKKIAEEINVDLFFCDYLMNYPCFDLAWKLGKPAVGSSTDHSYLPNPPYIADPIYGCHVNMENESFYNRFKCAIIVPLKKAWSARDTTKGINTQRALVGVDPHWDFFGRISTDTPLHQEIGPVLPDVFPGLTPDLDSFLSAHPRTLYFALGTNVFIPPQSVVTFLKSFLELINQDVIDGVIWSTVKTDVEDSFQLANYSSHDYPHIFISNFSPQFAILSHENTKIFLSHGGAASAHESMYTATPMLIIPIMGDQPRNAEKLELAGIALRISKTNLLVDDIVEKVKRLLNDESFKKNSERLQFLSRINSKRKFRAADLIEITMNTVKYVGVEDDHGRLRINNDNLLRDWITPDSRMGFIRGNYLDVYAFAIFLVFLLFGGFVYTLWK